METVCKTCKYRVYPTAEHDAILAQTTGWCNWLYNSALEHRR
jgi:hypothetical protein